MTFTIWFNPNSGNSGVITVDDDYLRFRKHGIQVENANTEAMIWYPYSALSRIVADGTDVVDW